MNIKKNNGSFNIEIDGMPYNTIEGDKYFEETKRLYEINPELFEVEEQQEKITPTYRQLRQSEYLPIEEQLDMIYWDRVNGTNNWVDYINGVKQKYPNK